MHWVIWLDPESDIFVVIDGNAMGYGMSDMMGMPLWVMEMSMLMFLCDPESDIFVVIDGNAMGYGMSDMMGMPLWRMEIP